jgi:hypothetical protein
MTMFLGLVIHIAKFLPAIRPFVVAGAILAWLTFFFSTVFSAELLTLAVAFWLRVKEHAIRQAEIALQKDLNNDGSIGPPQIVERAVPVYMAQDGTVLVPEPDGRLSLPEGAPPIAADTQRWIELAPSTRKMRRAELVHFLVTSLETTTDSHDGWSRANWRERGMSPKAWADVQNFIKALAPVIWKTADRPTLDAFLAQIAPTGTDRTGTGLDRTLMDESEESLYNAPQADAD